ncbi:MULTISPECIES: hypothetical protein [unclassified Paenibacillus]|uniref:hypothetical protein n=1 Tax=unclassified Paenibacillus TaxID=185978 RepID=UPI00034E3032|nr:MULTISPECIES: hypothetical protein [unclassified Paenibacillus]EPD80515.1 hypothetical protein HMPREF1207_05621 [Paenibacillus sp. HGH0039]
MVQTVLEQYQEKNRRLMNCLSEIANSGMTLAEIKEYAQRQLEIENIAAKKQVNEK